ncbi:hypothetical protein E2C01_057156 [Portunus trituberculatus]|uniref:Uncharacterized protein n=1 Tax=Portunus trituberculatus TaxID=210409 RepID=A0A5B7H2K8_PORTR|nr:hypothetical protein [Portunus trituberculatus]
MRPTPSHARPSHISSGVRRWIRRFFLKKKRRYQALETGPAAPLPWASLIRTPERGGAARRGASVRTGALPLTSHNVTPKPKCSSPYAILHRQPACVIPTCREPRGLADDPDHAAILGDSCRKREQFYGGGAWRMGHVRGSTLSPALPGVTPPHPPPSSWWGEIYRPGRVQHQNNKTTPACTDQRPCKYKNKTPAIITRHPPWPGPDLPYNITRPDLTKPHL